MFVCRHSFLKSRIVTARSRATQVFSVAVAYTISYFAIWGGYLTCRQEIFRGQAVGPWLFFARAGAYMFYTGLDLTLLHRITF